MTTRRRFIGASTALAVGALTRPVTAAGLTAIRSAWRMPDESASHARTWMAFGASAEIWGEKLLPVVQHDLGIIARTIARFEPVSMLVREDERVLARELAGPAVELIAAPLDDLWMRDTGPVFVLDGPGSRAAIDFNFNGWGDKQEHASDAGVARFVAGRAGTDVIGTTLVLEGGGIEVDGAGTAIVTESCVLNDNRNPGLTRAECESALSALLGLSKIVWLPGIRGEDITDGHTDFYARFARPGVVVAGFDPDSRSFDHAVTVEHARILRRATDAAGRRLEVVVIESPRRTRAVFESDDYAVGYIGFYVCNGAVLAQEFGDASADRAARQALQSVFPGREVVQLNVDGIAAGGGSIHCTTQQEPAARS